MSEESVQTNPNERTGAKFERLIEIMARLRAPGGCPWDREQTFDSIKPYLLEETYEVMDAVDERDWHSLAEELGDLLLEVAFFAEMADEAGHFRIDNALDAVNEKLVRRHPHVFAAGTARRPTKWCSAGKKSKQRRRRTQTPGLADCWSGYQRILPALVEAQKITAKAAGDGFDWPNAEGVLEKLKEELDELGEARKSADHNEIEGEIGDLLFVLVNLARFVKVDPEQALRRTNRKFRDRFAHIERRLAEAGRTPADSIWKRWTRCGGKQNRDEAVGQTSWSVQTCAAMTHNRCGRHEIHFTVASPRYAALGYALTAV